MQGQDSAGYLVWDPTVAAVDGAIDDHTGTGTLTGAGGGLISTTGTFYTKPTRIGIKSDVSDMIYLTGTVAGTMTVEIGNGGDDADRLGEAGNWATYKSVNGGGFSAGVATVTAGAFSDSANPQPIEIKRVAFGRIRIKFVVSGGTGTVRDRRVVKAS